MVLENATVPLSISTAFGTITGNTLNPVGVLRLVVTKAIDLKCPREKGKNSNENFQNSYEVYLIFQIY